MRSLARASPLGKFALGIGETSGQLMTENDAIVTRFLDDADFQDVAADVLAREICAEAVATGGTARS